MFLCWWLDFAAKAAHLCSCCLSVPNTAVKHRCLGGAISVFLYTCYSKPISAVCLEAAMAQHPGGDHTVESGNSLVCRATKHTMSHCMVLYVSLVNSCLTINILLNWHVLYELMNCWLCKHYCTCAIRGRVIVIRHWIHYSFLIIIVF